MATETDIRLRSWLDTNQREREQMCRSILALDPHYSDVTPRHPSGGPDGGRDIEAVFDGNQIAYGAVGFHNGANDSAEQKKRIKSKFSSDLRSALASKSDLGVFAFLTNLHFTLGEQAAMKENARKAGVYRCDIFDRERLRIDLDSPSGFFIRFQHLGISLSEAEQASFLARYGDRIQEVVSTGFQRLERTLNRILFLQEAGNVLGGIHVRFQLKKTYSGAEIGHFRAFVNVFLRAIKHDILGVWFGAADKPNRFRTDVSGRSKNEQPGIAHGIGAGQWERHFRLRRRDATESQTGESEGTDVDTDERNFVFVGASSSVGLDTVSSIVVNYSHDDALIRFRPRLDLRDLDDCMFIPALNRSLAEKVQSIEVFANGYKLAHIGHEDFNIDSSDFQPEMSNKFTTEELADPWVRIRPSNSESSFHLHFTSITPRRMLDHAETPDTKIHIFQK